MKQLLALSLVLLMLVGLCACGKEDTPISSSTAPTVVVYTENGVEVDASAFPKDTVLKVDTVKEENNPKIAAVKTVVPAAEEVVAYEITATNNNVAVQPDGTVEVAFPIPTAYDSAKHDVNIYYVADDGTTQPVPCTVDGDAVVGTLSHFSTYVVVLVLKPEFTTTATEATTTTTTTTTTKKPTTTTTTKKTTATTKKTTTTTKAKPISVENKCYTIRKLDTSDPTQLRDISIDFRTEKNEGIIFIGEGISVETHAYYEDGGYAQSYDEMFAEIKNECVLYKGKYYYGVMGGGHGLIPVSFKAGEVSYRSEEPGSNDTGSIQYTSKGNTITITKITGVANLVNGFINVGDTLTLDTTNE